MPAVDEAKPVAGRHPVQSVPGTGTSAGPVVMPEQGSPAPAAVPVVPGPAKAPVAHTPTEASDLHAGAIPSAHPRIHGGTAKPAPLSAGALTGYAGLEVSAAEGSVVQPPVAPAPAAASASPAAIPAAGHPLAVAQPAQLLNQVSQPLVRLAAAAPGEHVVTLSVTPENLGPVTVRAIISSEGVRVEMFAPTETAREALRHILVDLRRDLASGGAGAPATLTLSDQNHPGNGTGAGTPQSDDRGGRAPASPPKEAAEASGEAGRPAETPFRRSGLTGGGTTALDVMA